MINYHFEFKSISNSNYSLILVIKCGTVWKRSVRDLADAHNGDPSMQAADDTICILYLTL